MSNFATILRLFHKHPQSATSITALILEIALSENDENEKARILEFAKGVRSEDDNQFLLEDLQSFRLLEHEEVADKETVTLEEKSVGSFVDMSRFEGSDEEALSIEQFFKNHVVVPATHVGNACSLLSDRKTPISGEFIQNGRAYETTYRHDVRERCPIVNENGFYDGRGHETHRSSYQSKSITWRDGDMNASPPATPPPYDGNDVWDNDGCALFSAGSQFRISSDFGWRQVGDPPRPDFHEGVDIEVGAGVEVFATTSGTVTDINTTANGGNRFVVIQSGTTGYKYLHIEPALGLFVGLPVPAGALLGHVSGETPAIHLHYSVHENPPTFTNADMGDSNARVSCP